MDVLKAGKKAVETAALMVDEMAAMTAVKMADETAVWMAVKWEFCLVELKAAKMVAKMADLTAA